MKYRTCNTLTVSKSWCSSADSSELARCLTSVSCSPEGSGSVGTPAAAASPQPDPPAGWTPGGAPVVKEDNHVITYQATCSQNGVG